MPESAPPIIDGHIHGPTTATPMEMPPGYGYPLPRPPKKRGMPVWLLVVLLGAATFGLGVLALAGLGINLLTSEVCDVLESHSVATDKLGHELSCNFEWIATSMDERMDYLHYEAVGEKATGVAIVHTEPDGADGEEVLIDGTLVIEGSVFPLIPE